MSMTANEIETMIKEAIPDSTVVIEDLRGDGDHYSAHVKSSLFNGKSKIQQHQMVYKALKGKMGQQLHALALKTSSDD
ncbi:MAG: BolA family transcriptional regulator [Pelagibacterales bacterium]|jgi:stress-induced morphogen|nr:BolA family transcriptional regulator [Pelagibacterales bacterium]OUV26188.1 MAG: BolA family transcriptional regulator [Alphaproteobacteria bacterium TMED109]RCL82964.1 MAG: BolA family transcriptional regulator [Alphaproteobacteria bacterium]|tara:strand:- start:1054 stop:1287 length:234 start_codon:yes stop_codon:yes gene_type:complete